MSSPLETPFAQSKQPQLPQLLHLRLTLQNLQHFHCPSLDLFWHLKFPSCSKGPKPEHRFQGAATPLPSTDGQSLSYSCWPHYLLYKPGCHWSSWPSRHTAGCQSSDCQPTPPGFFPLGHFPAKIFSAPSLYPYMGITEM